MSQENNSNIDEILEQIKKWPEDMGQDSWNGIPRYRNRLYRDIILALEENDIDKINLNLSLAHKHFENCIHENKNANIVKLDVDIVMKLTERLLEQANNVNIDSFEHLFIILGITINNYRQQKEAKITGQDIEKYISLADKVFASSNNIKTDVFVLNNIFSILNNTIYCCNEAVKSESLSKVIEFVETVERDKGIQWDAVTIRSVLWALRSISERSESLSTDQADKIFNMTNAFVNKIDNLGTLNSTHVCAMLINPLKDMLCKKNNLAKIDVKQCLDLVKQILNKSDVVHHPNMGLDLIKTIIDIVNYYVNDEENEKDMEGYGFGIQNREIRAFDSNKLKKFVSEKMFDAFEKYLRSEFDAIEVTDNVIDNKYRVKVNANVPSDDQDLSEVQQNIEVHKSNLNYDQSKNNDVIEDKYSPTINVDMPTNNQNSSETSPNVSDNKSNIKKSMSFNEKISNFNQFGIDNDNNQFVQTGVQNNANSFEQPTEENENKESQKNDNKNNETEEVQKREAEYEPTKMFVILAVLSLFIPVIPGLIFVIVNNKKKESPLIKVLVFIPVVSPIILGIKTYQAYQKNKVLKAKSLVENKLSLSAGGKTNNFQNIHDMQKRKSEINGEKDESEKSNSTKGISDVNANDTK